MRIIVKAYGLQLLLIAVLASQFLMAQPTPPPSPTPLPGIIWLVAAGVALGGKKLWDKQKERDIS